MNKLNNSMLVNVLDDFYDNEFGGYYSAIDYDKKNILTMEKSVEDQSLVLLSLLVTPNKELKKIQSAVDYIVDSIDTENGGIIEFKENYGLINELGNTKTTYRTFLALYSILLASKVLKNDILFKQTLDQFEKVHSVSFDNELNIYYNKLTRDYKQVMDSNEHTNSLSFSILICLELMKSGKDINFKRYKEIFEINLNKLTNKMNNGAIPNITDKYGDIVPETIIDGETATIAIYALYQVNRYFQNENIQNKDIQNKIMESINYLNKHLWDSKYHGYFTHCNIDGYVTIHKEFVTLLNSAIPIKTSRVNLFIFFANKIAKDIKKNFDEYYLNKELKYLASLYDNKQDGFFIGEGYFWTPPATPVGPFHRLMLPSRETPGTFHFGSSSFLRLYNKYISSQAIGIIALSYLGDYTLDLENVLSRSNYKVVTDKPMINQNFKLEEQKNVDLDKYISSKKHIDWIMKGYTKNIGFGWTPNFAPIGTKPDRTPAVFGTHHSISNLKVLGKQIPNKKEIADWIRCCQSRNGAYGEYPGGPSDVLNTYLAINLLDILGETKFGDKERCVEYLQNCQNDDGGFGVVPGFKSDLFHSNLAAVALATLGRKPKNIDSLINYYLSARNSDGGFGEYVDSESDTYSCYRTISTFALYDLEIPNKEKTIEFIKNCQQVDGGFANEKNGLSSMIATYHCSASLTLLNEKPNDLNGVLLWLSKCQTADGGFSNIPGVTTGTIDEGFAAIQSICLLLQGLEKKWAVYVS